MLSKVYSDMEFSLPVILATLAIIVGFIWIRQQVQARKFPSGPRGLPFVGYLPFLGEYIYETLLKLGEKHGSVYSVVLGSERVVVLNDWAAVKAALVDQAQTFSKRPAMFLFDSTIKKRDISTNNGPIWKAQRNFAIQTLKVDGQEKTDRESLIIQSVIKLIGKFEKMNGQIIRIEEDDFFLPLFNIIWKIGCNKTIDENDGSGKQFYELLRQNVYGFRNNSPLNFMPYLRFLVPGAFGYWTYVKHHNLLWSYLEKEIEDHLRTFKEGECRDFLDAHIEEIHKRQQRNEKLQPPFTTEHIAGTMYDFYLAGIEETQNTLAWSIQLLSIWPQCQRKIQEELDEVIGRGRAPVLQDMPMLPYLEAVTLEIHRYSSVVPLSLFHSPDTDTEVLGHPIPKGCKVIQNIYGVHRDAKCWDNPFEFYPERFLDSQNRVKKPACLIPFSVGPRMCIGEPLAKQMIFLFLARMFQKLSFRLPPNIPRPSLKPNVGLTLAPKPFYVIVSTR